MNRIIYLGPEPPADSQTGGYDAGRASLHVGSDDGVLPITPSSRLPSARTIEPTVTVCGLCLTLLGAVIIFAPVLLFFLDRILRAGGVQ